MKNLRFYNLESEYESDKSTHEFPTVSYAVDNDTVYYMEPPRENYFIATYNVKSTTANTELLGTDYEYDELAFDIAQVKTMYIDDVEVTPTHIYKFDTTGEHTVKCVMNDNFTNCKNMFFRCRDLVTIDVSNFDTSKVTDMSYMFNTSHLAGGSDSSLTTIIGNLDTSNVITMNHMFNNNYQLILLDVSNWDTSKVTDMSSMFWNCGGLTSLDVSNWDTSKVTDMGHMFYHCPSLTSLDVSNFDTSKVTTMSAMFSDCERLTSLDVSNFDTSNVTDMGHMFYYCNGLTSLDVSNWDTSKVTDMGHMFAYCSGLTSIDLSNFDTSKVTNMNNMFTYCSGLTSLNVSNFDTKNVTNMSAMFSDCERLTSLDLSNWDTSNVTNMNNMFAYCSGLTSLDLSNWDVSKVTEMGSMFYKCSSLTSVSMGGNTNLSAYVYSMFGSITTNGTFYYNTIYDYSRIINVLPSTWTAVPLYTSTECTNLEITANDVIGNATTTTISYTAVLKGYDNFKLQNIENIIVTGTVTSNKFEQNTSTTDTVQRTITFEYMGVTASTTITQGVWVNFSITATYNVTNVNYNVKLLGRTYDDMTSTLSNVFDISQVETMYIDNEEVTPSHTYKFDTTGEHKVEYMMASDFNNADYMFHDCSALTTINVTHLNTNNVTSMYMMFRGCRSLTLIDGLNHINTSNVTDMSGMFNNCNGLTSLDVSNFDTRNVIDMGGMFNYCNGLTSLDLSNWDTSNVTNMEAMFAYCSGLTSIEGLSNLNTSNVTDMSSLFSECDGLTSLDLSHWDTSNVTDMNYMFRFCYSLESLTMSGPTNINTEVSIMFLNITTNGTFYYNPVYDYSHIINALPSTWTAVSLYTPTECTNLEITAEDVIGNAKTTTISYSATTNGYHTITQEPMNDVVLTDTSLSSEFGQNTSTTDTVQHNIIFEYMNVTASTTITQGVWVDMDIIIKFNTKSEFTSPRIFGSEFDLSQVKMMYIDDVEVTPTKTHTFQSIGEHAVACIMNDNFTNANHMFYDCIGIISLDVSNLDTSKVTDMEYMFTYCSGLTSLNVSNWDTSNVIEMSYMFRGCSGLTSLDLSNWDFSKVTIMHSLFRGCKNLTAVTINNPVNSSVNVSYMFDGITTTGTFYYSPKYDYSHIIAQLPSTWKAEMLYTPTEYTNLVITANDVNARKTSTTISYSATTNGYHPITNEPMNDVVLTGTSVSAEFGQNTSTTDTVQHTITFEYMGLTASTTITQGVWVDSSYTIDLNNQWRESTIISNPDSAVYDGVYESFSNKGVDYSGAIMYINIVGYSEFTLYIRSYAESNYDYVMVGQLDQELTFDSSYSDTTLVKAHTRGKQQSGTAIENYTPVTYSDIDGGEHRICIIYRKDSSDASGNDQGYVLIPKEQ